MYEIFLDHATLIRKCQGLKLQLKVPLVSLAYFRMLAKHSTVKQIQWHLFYMVCSMFPSFLRQSFYIHLYK